LAYNRTMKCRYHNLINNCETCGTPFHPIWGRPDSKYCSMQCYLKARWPESHKEVRHCKLCGNPFMEFKGNRKSFCSKLCQYKWRSNRFSAEGSPLWKGGKYPYYKGPNWTKQSEKARMRAGYKCQHCTKAEAELAQALDVDHIRPFRCFNSYKRANALSNLIALCRSCHSKYEHSKIFIPRFIPLPITA